MAAEMPPDDMQARLDFALEVALEVEAIILDHYQSGDLNVDRKHDNSPVTIADRQAETVIRAGISRHFPGDGVLGEEFGETVGSTGFHWVLDPLDGTKAFIHGVPLFGTLIGVEFKKQCVLGVCHFPALGETAWAVKGRGAWWRKAGCAPRRAQVSQTADLAQGLFSFTTVQGFTRIGRPEVFAALVERAGLSRGWGDCYGHILVATGRAEVMVDPLMNPWDAAAIVPIVEEAGGAFVDWRGEPTIYSGNGISVNAALRETVLNITRPPGDA